MASSLVMSSNSNNNSIGMENNSSEELFVPPPTSWFEQPSDTTCGNSIREEDDDDVDNDGTNQVTAEHVAGFTPVHTTKTWRDTSTANQSRHDSSNNNNNNNSNNNNPLLDDLRITMNMNQQQTLPLPYQYATQGRNPAISQPQSQLYPQHHHHYHYHYQQHYHHQHQHQHQHEQQQRRQQQQQHYSPNMMNEFGPSSSLPVIGNTRPSPSWKELSSQVLPEAARELLSSSLRRIYYTAKLSYSKGRWHRRYSDMGHNAGGYFISGDGTIPIFVGGDTSPATTTTTATEGSVATPTGTSPHQHQQYKQQFFSHSRYRNVQLPSFSNLPWIDRQLVREWRTYLPQDDTDTTLVTSQSVRMGEDDYNDDNDVDDDDNVGEDDDFDRARALVPTPIPRPPWQKSDVCFDCHKPFGPARLRHHCRFCGYSFCHSHSSMTQRLPHLGYDPDVPERVCDTCERLLTEQNLAERVAWRLARCRDYNQHNLTPYFETGLDSVEELALRVTKAAIAMAKAIPLGAQATVAVETVDVLRKYGLHGIYGIMLRQEFLAAADLLRKALGINKTSWPLSVHELSAAIFYALAQHRAMRGLHPEREQWIHQYRRSKERPLPTTTTVPWSSPSSSPPQARRRGHTTDDPIYIPSTSPTNKDRVTNMNATNENNDSPDIPLMVDTYELSALEFHDNPIVDHTDTYHYDHHHHSDPAIITAMMHATGKIGTSLDPRRPLPETEKALSKAGPGTSPSTVQSSVTPVCDPVPDSVLSSLVFYAPIALNFIYAEKEVEMQLLAAQQGWRLLYAFLNQEIDAAKPTDRPASAVFVHQKYKIACLSIRGTATINDVITDIRQIPVPFPDIDPDQGSDNNHKANSSNDDDWTNVFHGQGLALCGMASAAINLFREHVDALLHFAKQGYRIRLVGHSLGGGVATLMGMLVLRHLEQFTDLSQNYGSTALEETALLKVYAYGTPSCLDGKLAESVDSFVTTVVLHDDVFPRLTPTSCRGLLKHLLHIRETWVKAHIEEDLRAVGERAKTAWAPRIRQSFALTSSSSSLKKYCKKHLQRGNRKKTPTKDPSKDKPSNTVERKVTKVGTEATPEFANSIPVASDATEWGEKFFIPATGVSISEDFEDRSKDKEVTEIETDAPEQNPEPQLLLEFLGGGDNQTEGLLIDGDEFFETEENLLEDSDGGSELASNNDFFSDPMASPSEDSIHTSGSWSLDMLSGEGSHDVKRSSSVDTIEDNNGPVVLEECPLPRMFIPGKVIHIYSYRGVFRAAYVPRTFRELRRISLAGNMLSNHTTKAYFEGLLEVQTARVAPESPPKWTAFDEDDTCSCCANRFTWASTSNSEAQEARDKHNCRSCGGLVCDPCAKNRVPIPSIGITVPVRVCDRCYNDIMGGVSAASSSMTSSFLAVDDDDRTLSDSSPGRAVLEPTDENEERPERRRQKRSVVVDDLVSQMRSSALTHI